MWRIKTKGNILWNSGGAQYIIIDQGTGIKYDVLGMHFMDVIIYTVGHSNIEPDVFIEHLKRYNIDVLVDVRSKPYSQYVPSFNKDSVERLCKTNKIQHVFLGDLLGGKPDDVSVVRDGNKINYYVLSEKSYFLTGIDKLLEQANTHTVCIMCSEGQPDECHRNLLITPALEERDVKVEHILPDGTTISSGQLAQKINKGQASLF